MTFRTRLVLVAAVAVVIAILGASTASYFAARNALLGSVDGTLSATASNIAHQPVEENAKGVDFEWVEADGVVLEHGYPPLPVSSTVLSVASGHQNTLQTTIRLHGAQYREFVQYFSDVSVNGIEGIREGFTSGALLVVLPLNSVNRKLSSLGLTLTIVALGGIALAVLLAWMVGRTALVPLDDLTSSVEDVAETTDVSKRLDPGGPDELGRLRRAFNHLLAALERSRESQRQLVLDAGHELRTPLTSLRTNMEVVRRLDELDPAEREVLVDDLLTQMSELTNLVGDLSELARGEQRHTTSEPLRLDRLVEDAVAVATTHGRSRNIGFTLHTQPTWVEGQRERLARAVGNLLDNALKWSPNGGEVEVWCLWGAVTVRDHGPGIDTDDLPHVFDRFYRAPAARALPGSGLGLAIVAQVAEAEGGSVSAGNADDGGAVLQLALPPVVPPEGAADDDDQ